MTTRSYALDRNVPRLSAGRTTLVLVAAVIVAVAVNTVVARLATAGGATSGFMPLTLPVYGAFTLVGVLVGWAGWRVIEHRAGRPRRVLAWLVPVIGVLSFAPDVALGLLGFIPGANWSGVLGLMAMHLVVIAVAVPSYVLAGRAVVSRRTARW